VAECLAQRCSWGAPPPGLPVVPVALWVFRFPPLLDKALWMSVVVWLSGLFRGPDLQLLGMSLQPKSLFQASSWVAFRGILSNSQTVGDNVGLR
jgi:hypothetical protein